MRLVEKIVNDSLDVNGQLWSPALYTQLKKSLLRLEAGLVGSTLESLVELVEYEDKFIAQLLNKHYKISKSDKKVNPTKVINSNMTVVSGKQKKSVPGAYKLFYRHKVKQIVQGVKDNQVKGVVDVKETKSFVKELVSGIAKTQAATLALTTVNHVVAETRTQSYENHEVPQVVWVSILDSDTCEDCEELDGQIFDIDDAPDPPEHWNCRCHLEPLL